jgi:RNA polymerase sigma factor (sigma-70 family)
MTRVPVPPDAGDDSNFVRLLRDVKKGDRSIPELLDDPKFTTRSRLIIEAHSRGPDDTRELTHELRDQVWRYFSGFEPDCTYEDGKFFDWLRGLTRDIFCERLRNEDEDEYERWQDRASKNHSIYFEERRQLDASVSEFESCMSDLPEPERSACLCYIQMGLSAKETAELLTKAGYQCTQETVLQWISDGLKSFFPEAALTKRRA